MIAKLNGASSLSAEAQNFLASYKALLKDMSEDEATEATIRSMYKTYYAEMGGIGKPPEVRSAPSEPKVEPKTDNVTAFRRPAARLARPATFSATWPGRKQPLPVALIFACLVVVYVGIRYFWR